MIKLVLISLFFIILINALVQNVHAEQVQKCSFFIWFCHMEEHSTTKCDKGKFLRVHDWEETYYIHVGDVLVPSTTHHKENIYQFDCTQHYDNGTEIKWVEEHSD
jgi:hypothetical protein